jgi:hypothetical protein
MGYPPKPNRAYRLTGGATTPILALDDSLFCFLAGFATGGDWGAVEGLIGRFRVFLLLSG